jgi:Fis family transcriptional regulator
MSFEDTGGSANADTLVVDKQTHEESLSDCVRDALNSYFARLDGHGANNLFQLVMEEVERPLFQTVMEHTQGNQTRASRVLGISRSTLRKKLSHYNL